VTSILFDLDGVFYVGEHAIPGASETLTWVREQGIPHCFLTNTSSRPRTALVEKMARLGIETGQERLLTPPVAAVRWIKGHLAGKVALFVPAATRQEFDSLPLVAAQAGEPVAAVVVGDLGEGWDFATLNRAFRLLMQQPQPLLIALGMTRYWRAPDGLRLDVAPFVTALQYASGAESKVLGKSAIAFFEAALSMIGAPADQAIMIGDDIRGDVGGAQAAGISGVLVRTGKFQPSDLESDIKPKAVLDSIADLPDWWRQRSH